MVINYKKLGKTIKEQRLLNNLTQEILAEKCNLSVPHLSNIERGSHSLSLYTLEKLARSLNLNININLTTTNNNQIKIETILQNCGNMEYNILCDVLLATKRSLNLNLYYKS